MSERFMVDDCGTLIDMETRDTYDYVEEVCPLLNELNDKLKEYASELAIYKIAVALYDDGDVDD